jgi:hypothetical protein
MARLARPDNNELLGWFPSRSLGTSVNIAKMRIADEEPSYLRRRRAFAETRSLQKVTASLVGELEAEFVGG